MQKFRKLAIIEPERRDFWLWFIDHTRKELVEMACYSNKQIKEAKEQYDKITADKELMSLIIAAEIDEMDEATRIANAEEKGMARGIERGIEKGIEKAKLETAKKMLELGADLEFIEKATGLSKDEIEKLKS